MQAAEAVKKTQEGFLTGCPPCQAPVPTACLGGHTNQPLPCCTAAPFSCGATCGQPLTCGNHTCSKACHSVVSGPGSQQGIHVQTSTCVCTMWPCVQDARLTFSPYRSSWQLKLWHIALLRAMSPPVMRGTPVCRVNHVKLRQALLFADTLSVS